MTTKTNLKTGKTVRFNITKSWAVVDGNRDHVFFAYTRNQARAMKGSDERIARVKSITVEITK